MRVLITGAAGEIGSVVRKGLSGRYDLLRLHDIQPMPDAVTGEEVVVGDLTDYGVVLRCMKGIDVVVHLAGVAREGEWQRVIPNNVQGTVNVYEAARECGVKCVVFASTNHVIGFYRTDRFMGISETPRPDTRYGVSKVFGEALARYYADKFGLGSVCLRIGAFRHEVKTRRELVGWLSPDDCIRLVAASIEAPDIHFEIVYGVSNNDRRRWGNDGADRIGYFPQDNSEQFAQQVEASEGSAEQDVFHGGFYADLDFVGDTGRIA